jgi:hypothetical protein
VAPFTQELVVRLPGNTFSGHLVKGAQFFVVIQILSFHFLASGFYAQNVFYSVKDRFVPEFDRTNPEIFHPAIDSLVAAAPPFRNFSARDDRLNRQGVWFHLRKVDKSRTDSKSNQNVSKFSCIAQRVSMLALV